MSRQASKRSEYIGSEAFNDKFCHLHQGRMILPLGYSDKSVFAEHNLQFVHKMFFSPLQWYW